MLIKNLPTWLQDLAWERHTKFAAEGPSKHVFKQSFIDRAKVMEICAWHETHEGSMYWANIHSGVIPEHPVETYSIF